MNNVRVLVGDLFASKAQTLTNTVNTVGVMGKGIALEFKKRFPDMYDDYVRRCEEGRVELGRPYLFQALFPPWVLNFPTKEHWRSLSRLDAITDGLEYLAQHYRRWGIESLAVPPLGCGEGGLEWRIVGPALYRGLAKLEIPVELYAPFGTPHEELQPDFLEGASSAEAPESKVPVAGVVLASIVEHISAHSHHYPVGRIGLQKIAYFATQAGVPTGLEFERRPYGPFAEGLKRLVGQMINNGLIVERPQGKRIENRPGPTLDDAQRAFADETARWRDEVDRVTDLFLRLPSARKAEIAASVHYAATSLANRNRARGRGAVEEDEVIAEVLRWKERRQPPAAPAEVASAVHTLAHLGWIDVIPSQDEADLLVV